MAETCEESLMEMHKSFRSEIAGNLNASYLFDVSGPSGGKWILEIKSGKCELKKGANGSPTVTISISDQDWMAIHKGKLNSQMAFMMGKLRVAGDMGLAMKLQSMFPGQA